MSTTIRPVPQPVPLSAAAAALAAAAASAAGNVALYLAAVASGIVDFTVGVGESAMGLAPVAFVSAAAAALLIGAFALLRRYSMTPRLHFLAFVLAVLVPSFAVPFVLPGVGVEEVFVLELMHAVVASCAMWASGRMDDRSPG